MTSAFGKRASMFSTSRPQSPQPMTAHLTVVPSKAGACAASGFSCAKRGTPPSIDMAAAKEDVFTNSRRDTSSALGSGWDCGKLFMMNRKKFRGSRHEVKERGRELKRCLLRGRCAAKRAEAIKAEA